MGAGQISDRSGRPRIANHLTKARPMRQTRLFAAAIAFMASTGCSGLPPMQAQAALQVTQSDELTVRTYASQIKDVDSVNTHWFDTDAGIVVIDAQRILPEAEQAIAHLRASTDQPVVAIFITHPHTDHYGGLPVWKRAFPEAVVYASEVTLRSIREDGRGFNAARRERHGERFATQQQLAAATAEARQLSDEEEIEFGDITVKAEHLAPSESEGATVISIASERIVFVGDLINVGVPAVPFENLDTWLNQLEELGSAYGNYAIFQGHGPAPVTAEQIGAQRRFLNDLASAVSSRIGDQRLSRQEVADIAFELEGAWPFLSGVAGNTRREIFAAAAGMVAAQMGATVEN